MTDPVHGLDPADPRLFARGPWEWRDPSHGEHFRRCSYCGSMHPDDLASETGSARVDWADRKYGWPHKFYVHIANRNPDVLFYRGSAPIGASDNTRGKMEGWIGYDELTDEQRAILVRDGAHVDATRAYQFGPKLEHFAKFYTVHLADPTLSQETLDNIAGRCGLRFRFENGRVGWAPT